MIDKLQLLDSSIPQSERLDRFILWCNDHANNVSEILAQQIGVKASVVEVYFELNGLDSEELVFIDKKKIDIDALFIITKANKPTRLKVYENFDSLNSQSQRLKALKEYIDAETVPDFSRLVQQISPEAWTSLAKYLKARGIVNGTITAKFRSALVTASRFRARQEDLSDKMVDWIMRAITRDKEKGLNVFCNENIKNDFPDDYKIFKEIISSIESFTSVAE